MKLKSKRIYDLASKRVWIAGHQGMVGSALRRRLDSNNCEIFTEDRSTLDLRDAYAVDSWLRKNRPHAIFLMAGTVGGINANMACPADFIFDNLAIAMNVINAAHTHGVEKLLFPASSCAYPRLAAQPMNEMSLMTGPLEPTNESYAIAKIAGVALCKAYRQQYGNDYISVIPTNLYGPHDNYDLSSNHVIPALICKIVYALENKTGVSVWGTGLARREFLFVDDAADAMVFLMEHYSGSDVINIGYGDDISIADLTIMLASILDFKGPVTFDPIKPDGMPRKSLDSRRLNDLGWQRTTSLLDGLGRTCSWYQTNYSSNQAVQSLQHAQSSTYRNGSQQRSL